MLALDLTDAWQLVAQADHAHLSGRLAAAWGAAPFAQAHPALVKAAYRHDDGWRVWDEHPLLTAEGAPMSFLQSPVPELLHSYEACVDALAYEDAHAGLLVSMHVSGLRRGRYGCAPDSSSRGTFTPDPAEDPRVGAFVAAEEQRQRQLVAALRPSGGAPRGRPSAAAHRQPSAEPHDQADATAHLAADAVAYKDMELRHQYAQLQLFDVLSLLLCLTDLRHPGQERKLDLAPTAQGQPEAPLTLRTLGAGRVAFTPWPFAERCSLSLPMRRRLLPSGRFPDLAALRAAWQSSTPEHLRIELVPCTDSPGENPVARTRGV